MQWKDSINGRSIFNACYLRFVYFFSILHQPRRLLAPLFSSGLVGCFPIFVGVFVFVFRARELFRPAVNSGLARAPCGGRKTGN